MWFGSGRKGVGVSTEGQWSVQDRGGAPEVSDSAFPAEVTGPVSFNLLAVWAQRRPSYVRAILSSLDHYGEFLRSAPSIVVGDFNSHPRWDKDDQKANHSILAARLRAEFGLVSAFHTFAERSGNVVEPATLYYQWKQDRGFHIDYCFFPESWASRLISVEIGNYQEWAKESDHRPLIVDFEL